MIIAGKRYEKEHMDVQKDIKPQHSTVLANANLHLWLLISPLNRAGPHSPRVSRIQQPPTGLDAIGHRLLILGTERLTIISPMTNGTCMLQGMVSIF